MMDGLKSDNAKYKTSKAVKDILCMYCIKDMQSEAYQQNQNFAERAYSRSQGDDEHPNGSNRESSSVVANVHGVHSLHSESVVT